MRIWVDTNTGTWGEVTGLHLLDINDDQLEDFADMSDSDRSRIAEDKGQGVQ